jgi:hypothetical protein
MSVHFWHKMHKHVGPEVASEVKAQSEAKLHMY